MSFLFVFFCFFAFQIANSQSYEFSTFISSSNGLSQSTVNCIVQDEDGFLWIGTQDGLNQYDGYNFTYYYNQPGDSTSLSDNYITSLCLAIDGSIWVGTMSGGLNVLDKKTGRFQRFQKNLAKQGSITDNTIWALATDKNGNIYAGTNDGLNVYNPELKQFSYFNQNNCILPSRMVISLYNDNNKKIWIGTNKGLVNYEIDSQNFSPIDIISEDEEGSNIIIWTINKGLDGRLIFGTKNGILQTVGDRNVKLLPGSNNLSVVWNLFPVSRNKIWCGTRNGLICYEINTGISYSVNNYSDKTNNSNNSNVWNILKDRSGLIWTGSDGGLIKFEKLKNTFRVINDNKDKDLYLSEKSVNSILVDNNSTLWVGTDGQGLNKLTMGDHEFTVFNQNNTTLSNNRVWALLEDSEGLIWIGTYGAGLNCYDKKQDSFKRYPTGNDKNQISNSRILALYEDHIGNIWIGTRGGGLNKLNKKTDQVTVYKNNPEDKTSISSNTILAIAGDEAKNICISRKIISGFSFRAISNPSSAKAALPTIFMLLIRINTLSNISRASSSSSTINACMFLSIMINVLNRWLKLPEFLLLYDVHQTGQ